MDRKMLILVALVCGVSMGRANANVDADDDDATYDAPHQTLVERPLKYYVGLVGGIERMTGRRTEGLSEAAASTVYADNKRILENNSTISAVGGFLWKFPPLPIWMGVEAYLGRGNALSSVTANALDAGGNNLYYTTDFQRKFFYGGLIRVGHFFCPDLLGSISLGIDRSQFLTKRSLNTNRINRTKGFNGFLFGFELEKHYGHLGVGLDLKLIQYRRQLTSDPVDLAAGAGQLNFSVRPVMYSVALRLCYLF